MDFSKSIEQINKANNIAIFSHIRPDGDTIGSSVSLCLALKKSGKNVDILCDSKPERFNFIKGYEFFANKALSSYDLAIFLDCTDPERIGESYLVAQSIKDSFSIDHHRTNSKFAKYNYVDSNSAATCQLVYRFIQALNIEIDKDIATALYLGILTDTGSFLYNNTNADTFICASELCKYGIDINSIAINALNITTLPRQKLIARVINGLRMFADDKIAVLSILTSDLEAVGLTTDDAEGFTDYARYIKGVEVCIALVQMSEENYKVSFRSNGKIDVSKSAEVFGGGGHMFASGCRLNGLYEEVVEKVVKSVKDRLD